VFERNARFSTNRPVPLLGDDGADDDAVRGFYAFWHNFESWRDFSSMDEKKVEDAESREEKRWLMQQNKAGRAKRKRKENERVSRMVTRAQGSDPRVARARKAELEAKQRVKEERAEERKRKDDAKLAVEAEAARVAEVAASEVKADAERAKAEKHRGAKELRKARKTLKTALKPDWLNPVELVELVQTLDTDACLALVQAIADAGDAAAELPRQALATFRAEKALADEADEIRRSEAAAVAEAERLRLEKEASKVYEWSAAEMALLIKAVKKNPGGTRKRWEIVADQVNILGLAHSRTKAECIAKANSINSRDLAKLAEGGLVKSVTNLAKKAPPAAKQEQKVASAPAAKPQQPAAGGSGGAAAAEPVWSAVQQKSLEAALAKFPASMDKKERWTSIADSVPGKNRKECVARFKWIRAQVKARQAKGT